MWKAETRHTYDRKGLRYPTDMTDAEWDLARPFVDVSAGRGGVGLMCARCSTPCSTFSAQVANGVPCPRTCPRAAPCMTTSCAGSATARWGASIMRSTNKPARWPARRQARPRRSWIARA